MEYRDISTDTQSHYRLVAQDQVVFFILNRSGDITIELTGPGAVAHIFALYTGRDVESPSLTLTQRHLAPETTSSALVKAALAGTSAFTYSGIIRISPNAHRSNATQESRNLLLSSGARAQAQPSLEILAHDVACHHAATTAPLTNEALFFAQSRGLSEAAARTLLIRGFFQEALERMKNKIPGANNQAVRIQSVVDKLYV